MAQLDQWTSRINSWVSLRVTVTETEVSTANNSSKVTVKVELVNTSTTGAFDNYNNNLTVKINNVTKANQLLRYNFNSSGTVNLGSWSETVNHNSDGSKSVAVYAKATMQHDADPTYSKNLALTKIARATQPTLNESNPVMGETIRITMDRADGSFTHSVYHDFHQGKWTLINNTRVGTTLDWVVPLATFAPRIPNATVGNGRIQVDTYDGAGRFIGSRQVNFSAAIPSSVVPNVKGVAIEEAVAGLVAKFGTYVQSKSRLKVTIDSTGVYGSSITAHKITVDGTTHSQKTATTGIIDKSGDVTVSVEITDSRGRKKTDSRKVNFIAYQPPHISMFSAQRADEQALPDLDGNNLTGRYEASISPLGNKNNKAFTLEYRQSGTSSWSNLVLDDSGYTPQSAFFLENKSNDQSYQLRLRVTDYFATTYSSMIVIGTSFELMNFHPSGKGVAFGKVSEGETFEVGMPATFSGGLTVNGGMNAVTMPAGDGSQTYWNGLTNPIYFASQGTTPDQPANYGFVFIMRTTSNEWSALWFTQPQGAIYRKSGNKNSISEWVLLH